MLASPLGNCWSFWMNKNILKLAFKRVAVNEQLLECLNVSRYPSILICLQPSEWPDLAIFKRSYQQIFLQKEPKY